MRNVTKGKVIKTSALVLDVAAPLAATLRNFLFGLNIVPLRRYQGALSYSRCSLLYRLYGLLNGI